MLPNHPHEGVSIQLNRHEKLDLQMPHFISIDQDAAYHFTMEPTTSTLRLNSQTALYTTLNTFKKV